MSMTKTQLLMRALLARGYSRLAADEGWGPVGFAISPTHARRLDRHGARVWVNQDCGAVRMGSSWEFGIPMPQAMRRSLQQEGHEVQARADKAQVRSAKRATAARLGL